MHTVVTDGSDIYVAFSDFRDQGEDDDNDWNIYFAHSKDNGKTWEKNRRINDVTEGRDLSPSLAVDKNGVLYCLWVTNRETLFGQVAFSYSNDKGNSWSPSVTVTDERRMIIGFWVSSLAVLNDKLLVSWTEGEYGENESVISYLSKSSEGLVEQKPTERSKKVNPMKFEVGETVFHDDFSTSMAKNWKVRSGFWNIVNGNYMGVNPEGQETTFISSAKFEEPERYVLRGRFKLDPVAHLTANIYFRMGKTGLQHYVIVNMFRAGVWLSIKDNDLPNGLHLSGGKPLVQKRYSFRQDRWYRFVLVVTPERTDYYVDGVLMLSYAEKLNLKRGQIGIGGVGRAPTYFDDISVSEFKP